MNGKINNEAVELKCRQALLSLIKRKDFDEITVKDIAAECGFSRQYFYRFYSDKFDLVYEVIQEDLYAVGDVFSFRRSIPLWIEALERNGVFYRKVFSSSFYFDLYRLFLLVGRAITTVLGESAFIRKLNEEQKTVSEFLFHGLTSVLMEGLLTEVKIPVETTVKGLMMGAEGHLAFLFEEEATTEQIVYKFKKFIAEQ